MTVSVWTTRELTYWRWDAETCTVCGGPVWVMCYRGEGVCGGTCRDVANARPHADVSRCTWSANRLPHTEHDDCPGLHPDLAEALQRLMDRQAAPHAAHLAAQRPTPAPTEES